MKRKVELVTSGWDEAAVLDVIGKKDRAAKLAEEAMQGDLQIVAGPKVQASSMIGAGARGALRRRGTVMPTVMPLAMSTEMRTTYPMSGDDARSALRRRGTAMRTVMPLAMSTEMRTTFPMSGDDARRSLRRRGTMMSTSMPTTMSTMMPTAFPMSGDVEFSEDAKKVLAVGVLGAGAYGIYKLAGGGDGKPWIHRLNPLYWFKSENEKKFIDAEKARGKRNVELEKELVAAQNAYNVSQAAEVKEKQLAALQSGVKVQGDILSRKDLAVPPGLDPNNLPFVDYPGQWLYPDKKRDEQILAAIRKDGGGRMISKGARLDYNQSKGLYEVIRNFFETRLNPKGRDDLMTATTTGPAPFNTPFMATEAWMAEFIERNGVRYTDHDGKVYVMKNKVRRLAVPTTSEAQQMKRDSAIVLGDGSSTQTLVGPATPGMNPTLDKRALAAIKHTGAPLEGGATWTTEQANKAAAAVKSVIKDESGAGKWLASFLERQQINWVTSDGTTKGYKAGRVYIAAPAVPGDGIPAARGEKITIMGLAAEAPTNIPSEVKVYLAKSVATQSKRIADIAGKAGLINKKDWTEQDRDNVAIELLKQMMQGKTANPSDVRMSREIVILWAKGAGHSVPEMAPSAPASVSGDFVGDWWNPFSWSPVQWAGKQIARPFVWAGKELGILEKDKSPQQRAAEAANAQRTRRLQAYAAAAKSRAAAKARILAAEKKHEAAIAERDEEAKVANLEARAAEADAAANEAERIAIVAEAEKGLRGYADAVEGDAVAAASAAVAPNAPAVALADPRAAAVSWRSLANALKNNLISYGWVEKPFHRPRVLKFGADMGWWPNPIQFGTPPWIERLSNLKPADLIKFRMAGMGAAVAPAPSDAKIDAGLDKILGITGGPLAVNPIVEADKYAGNNTQVSQFLLPIFKNDINKASSYFAGYAERRNLTVYFRDVNGKLCAQVYRGGLRVSIDPSKPGSTTPPMPKSGTSGDAPGDVSRGRLARKGHAHLKAALDQAGVPTAIGSRWDQATVKKALGVVKGRAKHGHPWRRLVHFADAFQIVAQRKDGRWTKGLGKDAASVSGAQLMGRSNFIGRSSFVGWSLPKLISFSPEA